MSRLARIAGAAMIAGFVAAPGFSYAQSLKEQIVGVWQQVSIYIEEGGVRRDLYGDKPLGLTIFDRSGYYISYLSRTDLPKFESNNRQKGTDAEYRAIMRGMVAGFGTYTVEGNIVTIKWIANSYTNREGKSEQFTYTVTGDELSGVLPTASSGGVSYLKYVRAKQM